MKSNERKEAMVRPSVIDSVQRNREHRVRIAAEALLHNSVSSNNSRISDNIMPASSANTSLVSPETPTIHTISERLIAGNRSASRISPVRRFFCLFVTFDFLFTSLLWVICFVITGVNIWDELNRQIVKYNIHSSLFDVVLAASARFLCLILFYAIININHWWTIAISTAGSCAFLIAKVFLYNWSGNSNYTLEVLLILSSFVISWGEAWFLDFRVLPQESEANQILQAIQRETDREPLVPHEPATSFTPEQNNFFYSPLETPHDSEEEDECKERIQRPRRRTPLSREEEVYCQRAREALDKAWETLNSDGWKLEKESKGDTVHSKHLPKSGKVYKLTGVVDFPPEYLHDELFNKIEHVPTWNPTLTECRTLLVLDDCTDISYQVAAEGGGGLVSSRDFINLRHSAVKEGCYISSGVSVPYAPMPPQKEHVRGANGPGCWVMRPIPNEPNKCVFQWLLDTNLKGWLPQSLVDTALSTAMLEYIGHVRRLATKLKAEGKL